MRLGRFLHSAVDASALLMLLGLLAAAVAGGASLKQEFAWGLMMLAGIGAMLRSYVKANAGAFERAPLRESARDLQAVIFYMGFAWGSGAFLLLGDNPLPLLGLGFAALPSACLLLLLHDKAAGLAFIVPVTALTAAAMLMERWGGMPVILVLLLLVQGSLAAGLMLGGRQSTEPAGVVITLTLSLR